MSGFWSSPAITEVVKDDLGSFAVVFAQLTILMDFLIGMAVDCAEMSIGAESRPRLGAQTEPLRMGLIVVGRAMIAKRSGPALETPAIVACRSCGRGGRAARQSSWRRRTR